MCLALAYCLLKDGRLSYLSEIVMITLAVLELIFVKGKTCFICVALLMTCTMWRHYRQYRLEDLKDRENYGRIFEMLVRIVYIPVVIVDRFVKLCGLRRYKKVLVRLAVYSFAICAAAVLLLTLYCRQLKPLLNLIPGLGSAKSRLFLGRAAFDVFDVLPLGNNIPQWGFSGSEGGVDLYFALDSGYIKLLLEYGVIAFALILGIMTWAQLRLYKEKRYYAVFILAIFAIDGLMEYWIIKIGYNIFILLASCSLMTADERNAAKEEQLSPVKAKSWRSVIAAAVCCILFAVWCVTAYPISSWRGWTPVKGATVVIPGAFIDGVGSETLVADRLGKAAEYVNTHKDAQIILCSNDADALKEILIETGLVEEERIHVDAEATSVDSMLENTRKIIREEKMPPRITICACTMQQERISRHAAKMKIPLNSLTVDMPWTLYLPNFAIEQGRVLR